MLNTSWEARLGWDYQGYDEPSTCSMAYMTSSDPLNTDSWEYRGHYFVNPDESDMHYSNNHTHFLKYNDTYYIIYHAMILQENMKTDGGFRSMCIEKLDLDEKTLEIKLTGGTRNGVEQIKDYNPFVAHKGCEMASCAYVGFEYGENDEVYTASLDEGCWTYIKGVNFSKQPDKFLAVVKGTGGIEVRLDDEKNEPIAAIDFDCDEFTTVYTDAVGKVKGTHDVYIVFSNGNIQLDMWQFKIVNDRMEDIK